MLARLTEMDFKELFAEPYAKWRDALDKAVDREAFAGSYGRGNSRWACPSRAGRGDTSILRLSPRSPRNRAGKPAGGLPGLWRTYLIYFPPSSASARPWRLVR